jgi:putative addiction module component (TIGR02574 family)
MSAKMKQIIEEIKELTAQEKALVAHCLISSLENKHDEDVEAAWAELAEQRYKELESGVVQAIAWEEIKKGIKG